MSIFTATLSVWMAYRYRHAPSMKRALALGLAVGLAMMTRAEMMLLVPIVVIPLILFGRERATPPTPWGERVKRLAGAGLVILVLVAPWVTYNLTRFDKPVFLSTGYGITLLSATCDTTYYGPSTGYWSMDCTIPVEAADKLYKMDPSVADGKYRHVAIEYIKDHKKRFAYVTLVRWQRYFGIWDLTHNFDQVKKDILPEGREPWVAWSSAFLWFAIFPLAIAGAFVLRKRRVPIYIVLAPIIITFITVTSTFHQNRYRASAETAFCLLAAVAIDTLVTRTRRPSPSSLDARV
jgi:4-amino-4-deoxy-L-arabinose transferase-like glycosyltransferase